MNKYHIFTGCMLFILHLTGNQLEQIFTGIFQHSLWGGKESVSGSGSDLAGTILIRKEIPKIIQQFGITSIVDAPCGDFWWIKELKLEESLDWYLGVDIVKTLIEQNTKKYGSEKIVFMTMDLSQEIPPKTDLILCKDLFLHIQFQDIKKILNNFKASNSKYLLVSTFPNTIINKDRPKIDQRWRPVNLQKPPFNFPEPLLLIEHNSRFDQHLALWNFDDLPFLKN